MSSPEVRCACGALNDAAFDRCIRCGAQIGAHAAARSVKVTKGRQPRDADETEERDAAHFALLFIGGLCSVVFGLQVMLALRSGFGFPLFSEGGTVNAFKLGKFSTSLVSQEPLRLVSAVFAHYGLVHFGMNMLGLGDLIRMGGRFVGPYRVIVAFVLSGVFGFAANVATVNLFHWPPVETMGASGGIFGLLGLILGVLLRRKDPRWKTFAWRGVTYAVMFGFLVNAANAGFSINNTAHLGGLAAGVVFGWFTGKRGFHESTVTRVFAFVLIAVSILSIALAMTSPLPDRLRAELRNDPGGPCSVASKRS